MYLRQMRSVQKRHVDGRQAWYRRHWGSWAEPCGCGIVRCVYLSPSLHPRDVALVRRGEAEGSCRYLVLSRLDPPLAPYN